MPQDRRRLRRVSAHDCHLADDEPRAEEVGRGLSADKRWNHGSAFDRCVGFGDGTLWVDNGEYGAPVNFCPLCGWAAATPAWPRFVVWS